MRSAWAQILVRMKLTGSLVGEPYKQLRDDRDAQIGINGVLGAARFKYFSREGIVGAWCPGSRAHSASFDHVLECDTLLVRMRVDTTAADLLSLLPRKVATFPVRLVFPILEVEC